MRQVGIIGIGHTKFGKTEKGFLELLGEAALLCFEDAQITPGPEAGIDQVFVASMGGGMVNHISGSASALADSLHLCPAMAECVENGPASGASAVKLGYMAIASGMCDRVLVVGGEKMNGRGGAAAVLLCAMDCRNGAARVPVRIAGIGQATDTHVVANRAVPTDLQAVRLAARRAYDMAGITPAEVDVAELHDAFQILEIVESEEVGFFRRGEGHLAVRRGDTALGGKIPINTSGGLKAKGHPLGATGVSQLVELVRQLRGEGGERQVPEAHVGLAVNFGGFGNNVVATVLTDR